MKPYYLVFNTKGKLISGTDLEMTFKRYSELAINSNLKESLKKRIYAEQDFEVTIQELKEIEKTFDQKIEDCLKHPDFNPFKEKLRERFPNQYGSQPFKYKETTYYLYHKGREFYIDSLIIKTLGFKELVEAHLKADKPLKYIYKK